MSPNTTPSAPRVSAAVTFLCTGRFCAGVGTTARRLGRPPPGAAPGERDADQAGGSQRAVCFAGRPYPDELGRRAPDTRAGCRQTTDEFASRAGSYGSDG